MMPSEKRFVGSTVSFAVHLTLAVTAGAVFVGCSVRLSDVHGSVLIDDKPAPPGLKVTFAPQTAEGEPVLSATDTEGRYRLIHRSGKTGIRPGRYSVSLGHWGDPATNPPELSSLKLPPDVREGTSTLVCDVLMGGTQYDIRVRTR
jgi:hypothetical protein